MAIEQLIDPFYKIVSDFNRSPEKMTPGQLAWLPCQFVEYVPYILDAERLSPTDHYNIQGDLRQIEKNDFRKKDKLPVAALKLNQTEELMVSRAKKRLCILLAASNNSTNSSELKKVATKKSHLNQSEGLFLPLYSRTNLPEEFLDRVKRLRYTRFFYVPKGNLKQSQCRSDYVEKSIVRCDRIFAANLHYKGVTPIDYQLDEDGFYFLKIWLLKYLKMPLNIEQEETIRTLIELSNS